MPTATGDGTGTLRELLELTIEMRWKGANAERKNSNLLAACFRELGIDRQVTTVTAEVLQRDLVAPWRRLGKASTTINRSRCVVLVALGVAKQLGWIAEIPSWPMERMRVVDGKKEGVRDRFLTLAEETALLEELSKLDPAHGAFALFLVETGLRVGEAHALRWEDVKRNRKRVHVPLTKNGRDRFVPLSEVAEQALENHADHTDDPWGLISLSAFRRNFKRAKVSAELNERDVVPHTLRHTFATRLVQGGVPITTVSKLLGHSSLTITLRYAHHAPEDVDRARMALKESRS